MHGWSTASSPGRREFSAAQLKVIRRTIARSCTDAEFDEFIAFATQCALDPIRRQVSPLIVDAQDPERRRLICWTTIDGLRAIAARQGDYRPMETAPVVETDATRVDPATNPQGIVRAEVRAWKLRDGVWFAVSGEAWWDEHAPTQSAPTSLRDAPVGSSIERVLAPTWRRMGRLMIAKCAEAQALRRGWPDVLSGLYGQEELHALHMNERTASQEMSSTTSAPGGRGDHRVLWFVFEPGGPFVAVRLAEALRVLFGRYQQAKSLEDVEWFDRTNKLTLQTYWEWAPDAAFQVKVFAEACAVALAVGSGVEAQSNGEDVSREREGERL